MRGHEGTKQLVLEIHHTYLMSSVCQILQVRSHHRHRNDTLRGWVGEVVAREAIEA